MNRALRRKLNKTNYLTPGEFRSLSEEDQLKEILRLDPGFDLVKYNQIRDELKEIEVINE